MYTLSLNKNIYRSILATLFVICCYFALMEIGRLLIIAYYFYSFDIDITMADKNEFFRKLGSINIAYMALIISLTRLVVVITFFSLGIIAMRQKGIDYKMEFLFGLLLAYLIY